MKAIKKTSLKICNRVIKYSKLKIKMFSVHDFLKHQLNKKPRSDLHHHTSFVILKYIIDDSPEL